MITITDEYKLEEAINLCKGILNKGYKEFSISDDTRTDIYYLMRDYTETLWYGYIVHITSWIEDGEQLICHIEEVSRQDCPKLDYSKLIRVDLLQTKTLLETILIQKLDINE